jgi:hypothetical protein
LNTYPISVVLPSRLPNSTRSGTARSPAVCTRSDFGVAASAAIAIIAAAANRYRSIMK